MKHSYAGDQDITYSLNSFDKNYIEVSYTGGAEGVSYNSSFAVAIAKYVGVYELDVKIKDAYGGLLSVYKPSFLHVLYYSCWV